MARSAEAIQRAKQRYRETHREQLRAASRQYNRTLTPEQRAKKAATTKQWRLNNPDKVKRLNDKRDPEQLRVYAREWAATHKDQRADRQQFRESRKLANGPVEHIERLAVATRDEWQCGICGNPILRKEDLHIDHIVPLSKGGTHTWTNVQAAHAFCNLSKKDRLPDGYAAVA